MKCLFISYVDIINNKNTGGGVCSYRNLLLLKGVFENVDIINFCKNKPLKIEKDYFVLPAIKNKIGILISNIFLCSSSMTYSNQNKIIRLIKQNNYNLIFLETSNYGILSYRIKRNFHNIKVISFFQNIEFIFNFERTRKENFIYIILCISSYFNEFLSVKFSDKIIGLNKRDSKLCKKLYSKKMDLILSSGFEDLFDESKIVLNTNYSKIRILFVGSFFGPNYDGIKWFIKNVMPYVKGSLEVVGKNMETKKYELENKIKNVKVIGTVEDLSIYYYNCDIVIMPIFYGSGMKMKTVEAFMYGKTIFATNEALEGYEDFVEGIHGERCNTAKQFIFKINKYINQKIIKKYNYDSRKLFLKNYNSKNSIEDFKNLLKEF